LSLRAKDRKVCLVNSAGQIYLHLRRIEKEGLRTHDLRGKGQGKVKQSIGVTS